ncbi:hypothetical protein DP939_28865 [Spongiactinospora rosea]|uniref:Methyltransferase type 12 domain-containing protein n=1 Tax=Spongiactinospora rosea TaxID=2248750 RepID=A0A366LRV2_9ACTN|nr:hypothetical protein DP939_28865 [Spongiactinospora rosea]
MIRGPDVSRLKCMPDIHDRLHRTFFRAVSLLSARAQGRLLHLFFQWVHQAPDPWRYETEPYEIGKYEMTLRHIPDRPYRRALDVGCSEGAFTRRLARAFPQAECLGVDVSDHAISRAAAKAAGSARFAALDFLNEDPGGMFDLVVCAEMLYYVGRGERLRLVFERFRTFMAPGGVLVLVHEWPEARRLYRHLDESPGFRKMAEHPCEHPERSYAVTVYERVEPASTGPERSRRAMGAGEGPGQAVLDERAEPGHQLIDRRGGHRLDPHDVPRHGQPQDLDGHHPRPLGGIRRVEHRRQPPGELPVDVLQEQRF